ncbi:MAG: archease [Pseudomonadota bacterium]
MYEYFDHTADLGLRITATTFEDLLAEAGFALFSTLVENLSGVKPQREVTVEIVQANPVWLFFDWLTELLFLFESRHLLLCQFQIQFCDSKMTAICRGDSFCPKNNLQKHEIKAITYHELKVEQNEGNWIAEVILDI